jgi:hypothetical protein
MAFMLRPNLVVHEESELWSMYRRYRVAIESGCHTGAPRRRSWVDAIA